MSKFFSFLSKTKKKDDNIIPKQIDGPTKLSSRVPEEMKKAVNLKQPSPDANPKRPEMKRPMGEDRVINTMERLKKMAKTKRRKRAELVGAPVDNSEGKFSEDKLDARIEKKMREEVQQRMMSGKMTDPLSKGDLAKARDKEQPKEGKKISPEPRKFPSTLGEIPEKLPWTPKGWKKEEKKSGEKPATDTNPSAAKKLNADKAQKNNQPKT
jgi:hypothetical protein